MYKKKWFALRARHSNVQDFPSSVEVRLGSFYHAFIFEVGKRIIPVK